MEDQHLPQRTVGGLQSIRCSCTGAAGTNQGKLCGLRAVVARGGCDRCTASGEVEERETVPRIGSGKVIYGEVQAASIQ